MTDKRIYKYLLISALLITFYSCKKEDDTGNYIGLEITTQPDLAQVFQNESILIDILGNDSNISEKSTLTVDDSSSGNITINNNSSPNNLLDDTLQYTAGSDFEGQDTFQYTLCDANGTNCKTETVTVEVFPVSPVNGDLSKIPYATLSEYNFFKEGLSNLEPVFGVLPYAPISALFSDYAHKKRFVWLPRGEKASYKADGEVLDFPVGSIIIKNFYYDNVQPNNDTVIIETRLMIKKEQGWTFAEYFWNDGQTEAFIDTAGDGGFKQIEWIENGITRNVNYHMPSTSECFTCHKSDATNIPIGVKPQNLNANYSFKEGTKNQLQKWIEVGYLEDNVPTTINTVVDYTDTLQSLDMRVRSYLDINCASCHRDEGHCNYRSMRFAFNENEELNTRGVCVNPDTPIGNFNDPKIIKPGDIDNSVLYFRLNSLEEQFRMPLLGRRLRHDEGVALIGEWINSLDPSCN